MLLAAQANHYHCSMAYLNWTTFVPNAILGNCHASSAFSHSTCPAEYTLAYSLNCLLVEGRFNSARCGQSARREHTLNPSSTLARQGTVGPLETLALCLPPSPHRPKQEQPLNGIKRNRQGHSDSLAAEVAPSGFDLVVGHSEVGPRTPS